MRNGATFRRHNLHSCGPIAFNDISSVGPDVTSRKNAESSNPTELVALVDNKICRQNVNEQVIISEFRLYLGCLFRPLSTPSAIPPTHRSGAAMSRSYSVWSITTSYFIASDAATDCCDCSSRDYPPLLHRTRN